ncbi:MAG: thiamine pyrophosphate-dependent dehydrogenase E1 component subunit alpha [Acidobacteriota bacterium]
MQHDDNLLLQMYRLMLRIRCFEDKTKELYLNGEIRGTIHVSQGQEAVAAGACLALEEADYIITTHRGHGHCLARGVTSRSLLAEILGKQTGCCGGRAGSLHAFDASKGVLGAAAVVGSGLPIATGVALGIQMREARQVVLNFFGDGTANHGTFHEAINLGSIWKLPIVYLCENNQVADTTPFLQTINIPDIAARSSAYGIPGQVVDGNDAEAVYAAVRQAVDRARGGDGPSLLECKTYRWEGHHIGDPCLWRKPGELENWKEKCPIRRLGEKLLCSGAASQEELRHLEQETRAEMEDAAEFARQSSQPDPRSVLDFVWGEESRP